MPTARSRFVLRIRGMTSQVIFGGKKFGLPHTAERIPSLEKSIAKMLNCRRRRRRPKWYFFSLWRWFIIFHSDGKQRPLLICSICERFVQTIHIWKLLYRWPIPMMCDIIFYLVQSVFREYAGYSFDFKTTNFYLSPAPPSSIHGPLGEGERRMGERPGEGPYQCPLL